MFVIIFIFLIIFFSLYFEVLAGSMGLIIPLTALSIFYFAIAHGWVTGIFVGILAGTTLDMLYGRTLMLSPFSMMFVAGISVLWLHKGEPDSVVLHFFPGALVAFIAVFPILLINTIFYGAIVSNFFILVFSIATGAILLPILIPLYDSWAKKHGIPLYRGAKSRTLERR